MNWSYFSKLHSPTFVLLSIRTLLQFWSKTIVIPEIFLRVSVSLKDEIIQKKKSDLGMFQQQVGKGIEWDHGSDFLICSFEQVK